jgi:hypothetical protein
LGLPGAIITWTSTGTASMPWNATVRTRETMPPLRIPRQTPPLDQISLYVS